MEDRKPNHNVKIWIERKKLQYDRYRLEVEPGHTITWKLEAKEPVPFAVMIKSCVSPLAWSEAVLGKDEKVIVGAVRDDAEPGHYHYGVCAWSGKELIVDDPEIIVKPPKGGK